MRFDDKAGTVSQKRSGRSIFLKEKLEILFQSLLWTEENILQIEVLHRFFGLRLHSFYANAEVHDKVRVTEILCVLVV